ncbi:hypothetical protein JTB14_004663 [Gonioctena quinquepunctata]|nr:hypothetical protein JTB14_004663 [Gonioctena quinquepunctata]
MFFQGNQKISPYGENGDSGNDSCEGFGPTNCNTSRAVPCSNSISELTCEIEKMKIIQREQEQQIKELTKLNIELQRDVININRALVEKIEKMVGGGSLKKDNVEIGTVVDDEVHLGQNVFIKKGSYDTAYVTARSGTQFVKNIAMAVFGALTLKNSSVTGKSSNNIKKEICRPALCATKLSAIHDIYAFFLNNRGYSKLEIERELKHVNNYLASKISDLNRLPRVQSYKQVMVVAGEESFENALTFESSVFSPKWGSDLNREALSKRLKHVTESKL